ncbi:MAG: TetR/AcrR family transcriptional regulator [Beutenbergiaceae bacterium]
MIASQPVLTEPDGRSTRWDSHRQERRAQLCHLARKAVHRAGPDLSMDEIAAAMGTSKSIVYRYFTDKSGLQAAVGQSVLDEIADALERASRQQGSAQQRMRAMVQIYVGTLTNSPNVYRYVTAEQSASLSTFLTTVGDAVAVPLRELLGPGDADGAVAHLWAAGVVGFVRGAGESWLGTAAQERLSAAQMVDFLSGWLWRGATAVSRIRNSGGTP